jgi:DNA-directed RNA polymerase subunit RPC12/RpoP
MRVRCGSCRTEVEIPGPGRFNCPACGSLNEVRPAGAGMPNAGGGPLAPGGVRTPPAQPEQPSPRVSCPSCGFSFIVGDIEVAECPNCGGEVPVQSGDEQ